jgi:hypothetical protein
MARGSMLSVERVCLAPTGPERLFDEAKVVRPW